jgi:hypothetical protein
MKLRTLEARYAVVYEKDGKFCHKTADGREMCHATKEEAEAMVGKRNMRLFKAMRSGRFRTVQYQGREHLVVPVVALVQGVIHASNAETPELVLSEEFARLPKQWDGRPVMFNHPKVDGEQVSANDPRVLEGGQIGTVFGSRVEDDKLKMDAYIDVERVTAMGGEALELLEGLRAGEMTEVSVGTFVATELKNGTYKDHPYDTIWRDINSDHLAFLPKGVKGACSIEMGCGAPRMAGGPGSGEELDRRFAGEVSYDDVRAKLQKLFAPADMAVSATPMTWIESVFDDHFVYESAGKLFSRNYSMTEAGEIELSGEEPSEVVRKVVYEAAASANIVTYEVSAAPCGCGGQAVVNASAGKDEDMKTKKEKVAAIIASGKTCFVDADAALLEQLPDARITALEAHVEEASKTPVVAAAPPFVKKDEETEEEKKKRLEEEAKAKNAAEATPEAVAARRETFLKENPDIGEILSTHRAAQTSRRAELVTKLVAAQKVYTETELQALAIPALEKLAALTIKEKPTYEGQVPRAAANGDADDMIPPPPSMKARILEMRAAEKAS